MPINPLIALSGQNPLDAAARAQSIAQAPRLLELNERRQQLAESQEKRVAKGQQAQETRQLDEDQFRDMAIDAAKLSRQLEIDSETGNFGPSRRIIAERTKKIVARGGDPQDTAMIAQLLNQGRIGDVQGALDQVLFEGQLRGVFPAGEQVDQFRPVYGPNGEIVGQENLRTGRVFDDPRASSSSKPSRIGQRVVDGREMEVFADEQGRPFIFTDPGGSRQYLSSNELTTPIQRSQEVPFEVDVEPIEPPQPPEGEGLFQQAEEGTGPVSAARSLFATTMAIFGLPPGEKARGVIQARQDLNTASNEMIRALAVNPRFTSTEIDRVAGEIRIQPSFFDAPSIMQERMKAIDSSLRRRAELAEIDSRNPGLPTDVRRDQRANASAIRNFLSTLNVPTESPELTPEEQAELESLRQLMNAAP